MFRDPREKPQPPITGNRPAPANDASELSELVQMCRTGRIYAVESWIRSGKPIHAHNYRVRGNRRIANPLEVAIETNQFDLAVLLLCNGFPPDSEHESLLVQTLEERKPAFFDLLVAWGADPLRVDAHTVLATYDAELYERYWRLGLDFTRDHALARVLSDHSSNRPGYGWARRHKDDPRVSRELAMALGHAVVENRERAVALLVWAGADPHRPAPDLRWSRGNQDDEEEDPFSAVMLAALYGRSHLLAALKPHPSRDNFEELWAWVSDLDSIDYLAKIQTPKDWSRTLTRNIRTIVSSYGDSSQAIQCVEKLTVAHNARLSSMEPREIAWLRRDILKCRHESNCRWALRWMSYAETCDPTIYAELTRTASARAKIESLRIHDARYRCEV